MGKPAYRSRDIVAQLVGGSGPQRRESDWVSADALGKESGWRVLVCGSEGCVVALCEVQDGAEPEEKESAGL
jgi:hypothetical protein